jgi:membrane fusion protein, multidrug efflux system
MATIQRETTAETGRRGGSPDEGRGRRRVLITIGVVVLLAVLVWGVREVRYIMTHQSTDDAQVDGHIIPILARVGAYVEGVYVADNQHVAEGQVLVTLDTSELAVNVAEARADLDAAQAAAAGNGGGQAGAQLSAASSHHAAMEAQITAAKASADRAQRDYDRLKTLADQQIVSTQALDAARTTAQTTQADLESLERQASASSASVQDAVAGVRMARARLEAAQARLRDAQLQLSYARIVSPVAGIVSKKSVEPGQLVQPGQPVMAVVADTGMWVTANLKETQVGDVRVGQASTIDVDAYDGCSAQGVVESLSPATGAMFALLPPDNATGNFTKVVQRIPVRIRVTRGCGTDRPLRPGMSVEVHIASK